MDAFSVINLLGIAMELYGVISIAITIDKASKVLGNTNKEFLKNVGEDMRTVEVVGTSLFDFYSGESRGFNWFAGGLFFQLLGGAKELLCWLCA